MATAKKPTAPEKVQQQNEAATQNGYIICEEVKGEFDGGEWHKTRVIRSNVKLQEHTLDELNRNFGPHNPIKYIPVK